MPVAEYVPPLPRGDAAGGLASDGLTSGELAAGELSSLPLPQAGSERLASLAGWLASQGIGQGQGAHDATARRETVPTGFATLDRLLPAGGVRRGGLVEWIDLVESGGEAVAPPAGRSCPPAGSSCLPAGGATALACAVACRIVERSEGGTIVVVDRSGWFHPPAVLPWLGDRRGSLYVARPAREDDEVWAIDQALRCPGVTAVIGWPGRAHSTALRRWQLAARTTGAVGLFVRPSYTRRDPTWAEARVAVKPVALPVHAAMPRQTDLTIRRLHLSLVGGPWCGDETVVEKSAELLLDMRLGIERLGTDRLGTDRLGTESRANEAWSREDGQQAWRVVGAAQESRQPNAGARRPARACVQAHEDLPEHGKERVSCRAS